MVKIYMADNRPIRDKALIVLQRAGDIVCAEDTGEENFIKDVKKIDPEIMIVGARKVTKNVISSAKKLRAIIVYGVSYDFVDVKAASERGILVINTPGVNTISVAEFALGLVLALLKNIPQSYVALRRGEWTNMTTFRFGFPSTELLRKTVGIIGLGNIGSYLAKIFNAMGTRVISHTQFPSDERAKQHKVEFVDLDILMSKSDVIVVSCALTDRTKGMIGKRQIALMKPDSYIVNVSRGAVIDERELLDALMRKKIAGAAMDVLTKEPNTDSPFFKLENVICTPHIAGQTTESAKRLEMIVAEEASRIAKGKRPHHAVNEEALE